LQTKRSETGEVKKSASIEARLKDEARFFRNWLENPKITGAVSPSGRFLARMMARYVDPSISGPIIELGPGTGPVTQALLAKGIAPERLILVEFDTKFCELLARRFPRCRIVQGDAYDLAGTLAGVLDEPAAAVVMLGGDELEPDGLDLRGAFVGSEGMMGIATKVLVRLTQNPPAVKTMLMDFMSVEAGAQTVSDIIAAGMVPAALEMMDKLCVQAVEAYIHAGLPLDAAAVLLVEVAGLPHGLEADTERIVAIGTANGARTVRIAKDEAERALLWKGRKTAFGAIARIKPNYYLHDTVVPRRKLPEVLRKVYEITERHGLLVLNVFHAGDGNLHPLLVFDKREPGVMERVHAAGEEIVRASVEAGGVLSGEHGIGLEKRDFMPMMFGPADLAAQAAMRRAFDPIGLANPFKVLPSPGACGDVQHVPDGAWV
jgi:glycolate oxidase